jgi:diguanylate cyclase (GGDEF)-like protein
MSNQPGPQVPRASRFLVIFWPALALLVAAAVWGAALMGAGTERARAEALARKDATAYAEAYEQYLTRSVAQMDQITMQLKFAWEHSRNAGLLEQLRRDGMFTDDAFAAVCIVDRNGVVRSATREGMRARDLSHSRLFSQHRDNISTALRIGVAPRELALARGVVVFTRRLDTADDEFDGVVLMAVDAGYFTSFVSPAILGRDGSVALAGAEGRLRIEQRGSGAVRAIGPGEAAAPLPAALWRSDGGAQLEPATTGAQVLGWRHSAAYPFVALVGLSHQAVQASADAAWRESRDRAIVVSACLAVLGALGAVLGRRAALRELEQQEVRRAYRTATESGADGFYMVAPVRGRDRQIVDCEIVDCNERGASFYGLKRADMLGQRLGRIDPVLFGEELLATYRSAMETGFYEEDREMPSGARVRLRWGRRRLVRVGNALAVTLQDISERKAHEQALERMANEDSLTGLANRHAFLESVPDRLAAARASGTALALLFIDLDDFKQVNDTHGHAAGDALLKLAAQRLQSLLRPSDQVARCGGDEFLVLLDPCDGERDAAAVAERIVAALAAPFAIADEVHAIGASVGISLFPRDGADAATLIRNGDIAMYAGKADGKGQYRFYDPSLSSSLHARSRLKRSMLEAIERDQFVLHYQPRVDAASGRLLSMEALLRWQHPELGMIAPGEFIPLAESSGLIVKLGDIVIDKACAQVAAWRDEGAQLVPVSINVSPKQFLRGGVRQQLAQALARFALPASLIEVEITESAMMGDQDAILDELEALRALGIKLHVDDFGTGYSSLSQLQRLKMDVLKVDRAFTAELGNSREGEVFFQAIVSMAHALGMEVVAEGVETEVQLEILRALGCNEVQGYLIARPVAPAEMAGMMRRRHLLEPRAKAA